MFSAQALLFSQFLLMVQDTGNHAIRDNPFVTGRIICKQRLKHLLDLCPFQLWQFELWPCQAACCIDLPHKGSLKGPCTQRLEQSQGLDVHLRKHYIGQKPCTMIKNRAIDKLAILFYDGDVIEMPVIVGDQSVDFKEQCQVLRKLPEACSFCCGLGQVQNPLFITGEPAQLLA